MFDYSTTMPPFHNAPYRSDMVPSDYSLFSNLKKELRGHYFTNDNELQASVIEHFKEKLDIVFIRT